MGLTKSVTLLSLLAASSIGFAAPPERDFDRTKQVAPPSLFDCLGACNGGDCLRECVASQHAVEERGIIRPIGDAPSSSEAVVDCLLDGLGNVGTCADIFLGVDPNPAGFRICVAGAGRVFLKCTGVPLTGPDAEEATEEVLGRRTFSVLEQKERTLGVEILLSAAQTAYQAFLDPEAEPFVIQIPSEPMGGGVAAAEPVKETFDGCADQFGDNLDSCATRFPDTGSFGRKACDKGAERVFNSCLGLPLK